MNFRTSIIIILIFIWGCKNGSEKTFTIDGICECYKNQQVTQIDERLSKCLNEFNEWINSQTISIERKEKLAKKELLILTNKLIESCSIYQSDFNKVLLYRYKSQKTKLSNVKRDSTISKIKRGENSAVNKAILAEYEIIDGNYEAAMDLVLESISEESDREIAYWVRVFLYHRNGEFDKAINDCETLLKISKNPDMLLSVELLKLNLEREKLKN